MSCTAEIYSEAILFMLDSMAPHEKVQLKDDIRFKLDRAYELQPSTMQGTKSSLAANESQRFVATT